MAKQSRRVIIPAARRPSKADDLAPSVYTPLARYFIVNSILLGTVCWLFTFDNPRNLMQGLTAVVSVGAFAYWRHRGERLRFASPLLGGVLMIAWGELFRLPVVATIIPLAAMCIACIVLSVFRTAFELNQEGLRHLIQNRYDSAVLAFSAALRRSPGYFFALSNRGQVLARLHRDDDAFADLAAAIAVAPDHVTAYSIRAVALFERERWREVIDDTSRALCIDPKDRGLRYFQGYAFLQLGEVETATGEANRLVSEWPVWCLGYVLRGWTQVERNDFVAAVETVQRATTYGPNDVGVWHGLGLVSACSPDPAARDSQRAIAAATRSCELSSWKQWNTISVLAAAYAEAGQFDEAIRWAKESLRLAPPEEQPTRQARIEQYQNGQPYRLPQT